LVVRNGSLVTEAYFHPYQADTSGRIQSITKSVIGMLVGIAIDRGYIKSVDEPMLNFFPGRKVQALDSNKREISLKHLLTMSSGLDCDDGAGTTEKMMASPDWVQFMLDLPMTATPGTKFHYCSGNAHLLSAVLRKATGKTAREFANEALFAPIGIQPIPETGWLADPQLTSDGSSGLYLTPQEIARLGWLAASGGRWGEYQVISEQWMADSFKAYLDKGDGSSYGYLWTVYPGEDHAAALGLGGQQIHVYPKQGLAVVFTGAMPVYTQIPELDKILEGDILAAVQSAAPLREAPEAVKALQAKIQSIANPVQPVPALPALAADVSSRTYQLEENPLGYKAVAFHFMEGSSQAELALDQLPAIAIGLDNLYRLNSGPAIGKIYARGRWIDNTTFEFEQATLGELADVRALVKFQGNAVTVELIDAVFGNSMGQLHGVSG
jgi:CubicO group peptidase (beta-lactamase class C family)